MTKQKKKKKARKDKGKKRKPYETTRRYPTKHKTTTPEGRKEYMRQYMKELRKRLKGEKRRMEKLGGKSVG